VVQIHPGIHLLRAGIEGLTESGSTIWTTAFMAVLAGALTCKGDFEEAAAILENALRDEATTKDLEHRVETLRRKGELLMALGDNGAAEATLHEAIALAREQGAMSYELRACTTLAELLDREGRVDEACEILGAAYDGFTDGFETPDLVRARAFLAGCAEASRQGRSTTFSRV